mgnify:FL=1
MIEIKKIITSFLFKTKENPPHYLLDHKSAEIIWKSLFESGNEEQARMLSKAMIEQGCQEVEVDDTSLVLMFWKDYMEENGILTFRPADEELH